MTIYISFVEMIKQIRKKPMFVLSFFAPLMFALACKYLIPYLEKILTVYFNLENIISPYYIIIDVFISLITPYMTSFTVAIFMLEEIDDKIPNYFAITPLGRNGYIFGRFIFLLIISFFITIIILYFFNLTNIKLYKIIFMSFAGTIQGFIYSLLIITLSKNKLEGVVVAKFSSLFMFGIFASFLINGKAKYIFYILPTFWTAESVKNIIYVPVCVLVSFIWIYFLLKKFYRKIL